MRRWAGMMALTAIASLFFFLGGCGGGKNFVQAGDIDEHVIVHPVPTDGGRGCSVSTSDPTNYSFTGWKLPSGGITYWVNPSRVRVPSGYSLTPDQIVQAVKDSFAVWSAANPALIFTYGGTTSVQAGRLDGINAISWRNLQAGALAVTYVWVSRSTGRVIEADTAFNNRLAWYDFIVPDGYTPDTHCPDRPVAYDIRNIATHEFGHWIGLADLYNSAEKDATMYGYGDVQELKKRTLATGDKSGAQSLTP
ncbi:MAG: matrixin family metalloprotease [Armatimonadetes bacterium]|nr:matrixin family metalloprotease [Armatimonadota bacterium]